MTFYTQQHELYCGIDLHAKRMYACIIDQDGKTLLHRNLKTQPQALIKAVQPFQNRDLVVGVESTYNWYWLADCCEDQGVSEVGLQRSGRHPAAGEPDCKERLRQAGETQRSGQSVIDSRRTPGTRRVPGSQTRRHLQRTSIPQT